MRISDWSSDVCSSDLVGYYAHVNASSPGQLRCSLHETIRGHAVYPYSGSGTSTWTILEIADEDPPNAGRIIDVYRNRSYAKGADRARTGSGLNYNREHTWPNSLRCGRSSDATRLPSAPYPDKIGRMAGRVRRSQYRPNPVFAGT